MSFYPQRAAAFTEAWYVAPMLSLALLLSSSLAQADDCVTSYALGDVEQALTDAEAAYAARNRDSVHANVSLALDRLRCLQGEVNVAAAARIHRAVGLDGVVMKNDTGAVAAFAAARAIEPSYDYTAAMAPEGSALRTHYTSAKAVAVTPPAPLEIPENLKVRIDGASAAERPTWRPAVVQGFDTTGKVLVSGWYASDAALTLPVPPEIVDAPLVVDTTMKVDNRPPGPNRALLIGAIGAVVAGGALYGAAWVTNGQYENAADGDDTEGIIATNHALTISAFSVAGAGAITGVLAVATGRW